MKARTNLVLQLLCVVSAASLGCGPEAQPLSPASPTVTTETPSEQAVVPSEKPSEPPTGADVGDDKESGVTPTEESKAEEPDTTPAEDAKMDDTTSEPAEDEAPAKEEPSETDDAAESATAKEEAPVAGGDRVVTGDWPCWGGDIHRNMVNTTTGISIDFEPAEDPKDGKNVLWTARLGSQTYGNPVVAGGKVFVGTNNGGEYRPKHEGDRGCVLCFEEKTGKFLWQLTREKLPQGRVNDWPEQGICSTPFIEGDRMWVVTNRCELMCVDTEGFLDGENDGPYTDEVDSEEQDADIVWILDMIEDLGVFPHNLATSSPVVYEDHVMILTSNGVDEAHLELPAPRSPSFLGVNKTTGEIVWEDNTPFDQVLHGQWSSPAMGIINGQAQVYMPGGDGWLYALDAKTGEQIWKFDLNPKDSKWELGGRGSRNSVISTPVFYENSVVLGVGQDPEHGESIGHIYRIDATKKGDISPTTPENEPNPNSGQIWHLGGIDEDGSQTGKEGAEAFRRTMSTVAISDGLVFAPDLSGRIHYIDFETGKRYWEADVLAAIWGSPMVADGKMFVGDEDGILSIFPARKELSEEELDEPPQIEFESSIYSTPTIANGVIFITDRSRLYAIATQ